MGNKDGDFTDDDDVDKLLDDDDLDKDLKDLSDFSLSDSDTKAKTKNKNIKNDIKPDKNIKKLDNVNKEKKRGRPSFKNKIKSPTLSDLSGNEENSKPNKKPKINDTIKPSTNSTQMDISESILQIRQLINISKPFNKKEKILILDALLTDDRPSDKSNANSNKKIISN